MDQASSSGSVAIQRISPRNRSISVPARLETANRVPLRNRSASAPPQLGSANRPANDPTLAPVGVHLWPRMIGRIGAGVAAQAIVGNRAEAAPQVEAAPPIPQPNPSLDHVAGLGRSILTTGRQGLTQIPRNRRRDDDNSNNSMSRAIIETASTLAEDEMTRQNRESENAYNSNRGPAGSRQWARPSDVNGIRNRNIARRVLQFVRGAIKP